MSTWETLADAALLFADAVEGEDKQEYIVARDNLRKAAIRYREGPRNGQGRPLEELVRPKGKR